MSALAEAVGGSLELLAHRDALTAAQRNYRSTMHADLLACQLRQLVNATSRAAVDAAENAADVMAWEIGTTVLDMRNRGADDAEVVDGVMALIQLRMVAGMDDPVGELTGGEAST